MVFADLCRSVPLRFEEFGNRRVAVLQTLFRSRQANFQQTGAEGRLPENECSAPRRAGLLRVIIREQRAFAGDAVNVRRASAHHAAMICADVPDADIVRHDDDDVRFLGLRVRGNDSAHQRRRSRQHGQAVF